MQVRIEFGSLDSLYLRHDSAMLVGVTAILVKLSGSIIPSKGLMSPGCWCGTGSMANWVLLPLHCSTAIAPLTNAGQWVKSLLQAVGASPLPLSSPVLGEGFCFLLFKGSLCSFPILLDTHWRETFASLHLSALHPNHSFLECKSKAHKLDTVTAMTVGKKSMP